MKILLSSLLLFFAFQVSFGQELKEGEYWNSISEGRGSIWEYKFFTKDEVIKANQKLLLLKKLSPKDEWEGVYESGVELGESLLYWNSYDGFVKYFYYHTLKTLDYGKVINKTDSVLFETEKTTPAIDFLKKTENPVIKVKIDKRHFLVPKRYLRLFCEYAVGLRKFYWADIQSKYWSKISERFIDARGLPILPEKYKRLLVYPIEAKISKIGKKTIIKHKNDEGVLELYRTDYLFILNAGKNKGVKKEMEFYIPELKETASIKKVSQNTAIALISRDFDKNNIEVCQDKNYKETPCSQISVGMWAKTIMAFED